MEGVEGSTAVRRDPTPITVLTGALGAGKTTLLKYVLESQHGYRIAVIQNEFSEEMGIESPLITDSQGEAFKDIVELPNGCLCCSAKDGLISALDRLLEERQRFDYVLVEATGIADPESICEIFWVDEELGSRVYLDGIVTLVDCRNVLSALGEEPAEGAASVGDMSSLGLEAESAKQVACADVLILNKTDLVPKAESRATVVARLATMNPTAVRLETTRAVVTLSAILGIRAFHRDRLVSSLSNLAAASGQRCGHAFPEMGHGEMGHGEEVEMGHDQTNSHGHSHAHTDGDRGSEHIVSHGHSHAHTNGDRVSKHIVAPAHGIESLLLRGHSAAALYDARKVETWLAEVLWEESAGSVYRCKGLFRGLPPRDEHPAAAVTGGCGDAAAACRGAAYTVQGVGKIYEVEEAPGSVQFEWSKLLFIGRGLRREMLEAGFQGCSVAAAAA